MARAERPEKMKDVQVEKKGEEETMIMMIVIMIVYKEEKNALFNKEEKFPTQCYSGSIDNKKRVITYGAYLENAVNAVMYHSTSNIFRYAR